MKPGHELLDRLRNRTLRAVDLVSQALARIERLEPTLHAFLLVLAEEALERAAEIDQTLDRGDDAGPLAGLPVAVKDNICLAGHPTTCASRMLEDYVSPFDATAVSRLRAAGAVLVGKTNLDEFAMGSSTEQSAFGPTRNPWDPGRVPGGSSGGSAAAVAAGEAVMALGSDTGGSIRQPAAFCGVTGLKPTYGRVSRYGLVAFASSLDQVGPLTRDVRDCARILGVIAGHDPRDATSVEEPVPDYEASLDGGVEGLRAGVPAGLPEQLPAPMAQRLEEALEVLRGLGLSLEKVDLPGLEYALPAYYIVAPAEASSNLARFDGVRYGLRGEGAHVAEMMCRSRRLGFGPEVKRRIMLGTYALSSGYYDAYYLRAQKVRTLLRRAFDAAFERVDLLAMPATPSTAFPLGEKVRDPLEMYRSDIFTVAPNLTGLPALVIPSGLVEGLPTGLQLVGPPWSEPLLLRVGHAFQAITDHHRLSPPLAPEGGASPASRAGSPPGTRYP